MQTLARPIVACMAVFGLATSSFAALEFEVPPNFVDVHRGRLLEGDLESILRRDNDLYRARPGVTLNSREAPVQIDVVGNSVISPGTSLELDLYTSGSSTGIRQSVLLFNIFTQRFDEVDARQMTLADSHTLVQISDPLPYITPAAGTIRMRLAYQPSQPVPGSNWEVRVNQAIFRVFP